MSTVLISNPYSRKNRGVRDRFTHEARACFGDRLFEPRTRPDLMSLVSNLRKEGVKTIAISGGDGTISDVMTALHQVYRDDHLPTLAIFPSGNSNLIARAVGCGRRRRQAIARLLEAPETLIRQSRTTLKVRWTHGADHERIGMFHGTTGFTRAIDIAHGPKVLKWAPHNFAVAATLVATAWQLLQGKHRRDWLSGDALHLSTDGRVVSDGASFMFISTALERLTMGMWPFWNEQKGGDAGTVRYLNIRAHPSDLWRAVFLVMRGKTAPWLQHHSSYQSGCARALALGGPRQFVLDGEIFESGPTRQVEVLAGPRFVFLLD